MPYVHADVRSEEEVDRVVATALDAHGGIDVLVANHGAIRGRPFLIPLCGSPPSDAPVRYI